MMPSMVMRCPACGHSVGDHCTSLTCNWFLCLICKSSGIGPGRFVDVRDKKERR